jgi:hypothetical protein
MLAFVALSLLLVHNAFGAITCRNSTTGKRACTTSTSCPTGWTKISTSCSTQTVGGSITYISHHGIGIKCAWQEFEGEWSSNPGIAPDPISVSQSVEGEGNYATCGGWDIASGLPVDPTQDDFNAAPYGSGKFFFKVKYESTAPLTCVEDPNAGIGNNCTKTDAQNPKHDDSGATTPPGASRACALNSPGGGTTLTYQFACADGVSVTGFLTLVPSLDGGGTTQVAPNFTGPCSPERVADGKCTMQLGGIPKKTVKVKGQNVTVVDSAACEAAFPAGQVVNALGTSQTQNLDLKEILFYQEVASEGICDATTLLPTVVGLPAAAYGRYCQSDLGLFSDNTGTNFFAGDPSFVEGFDNELRVCPPGPTGTAPHTATQDVEQVKLSGGVTLEPQGPLNLNCTSGSNTDSGGYKVKIPDQSPLLSVDIDTSTGAPKLEGVSPTSAAIVVDTDGVRKLELTYPTCNNTPEGGLSGAVIANNPPLTNNQNVTLHLEGQTNGAGAGSLGPVLFEGEFTIKVNGL